MIQKKLNSEDIRNHTLMLVEPYRQKYLDLIIALIENEDSIRCELYYKILSDTKGVSNIIII